MHWGLIIVGVVLLALGYYIFGLVALLIALFLFLSVR